MVAPEPMKLLFDFLPLLLFFAAFRVYGIYVATGVAIAASLGQILWLFARKLKIEPAVWVSLTIIVLFGGATIILHDETFIKWKPTVLYWIGALVLGGGEVLGRSALRGLLGSKLTLPVRVWKRLSWAWVAFLVVLGAANLAVAMSCSTATWVSFKVFGLLGLMLVFIVAQSAFLSKYMESSDQG